MLPEVAAAKLKAALGMHQQGRLDHAEALYKEVLLAQPQNFNALQLLATIAAQRQNSAAAVELFDQALRINPRHAGSLNNRGIALRNLGRLEEAVESCDRALSIQPDYVEAHNNRGVTLRELGRVEEALESYDRALALRSDHAEVLYNRANALYDLNRLDAALESYDHALMVNPDYADALNDRGIVLEDLQRPDEALASYGRALRIRPDYAKALGNRGNALQNLRRFDEALASYEHALNIEPDNAEVHWNESLCRLLTGDFARGWQKYEWRWKNEPQARTARDFVEPLWLGKERLEGKTILLHSEQGLGDTLQFCRYASQVAGLGARVILEVQPSLRALLSGLQGAAVVLARGEELPEFDCHCPLLSLPLALGADLGNITGASYLKSDGQKMAAWGTRISKSGRRRIGLVWSGGVAHENDRNRSIPLERFRVLITDQADYYCLQTEVREADRAPLESTRGIRFFGDELRDFSDTAALVGLMDLVITVDTSVAHLAGAMGKEVWVLLPFSPDWRWLLDRSDSPWYESARLFRQPVSGDWDSVLAAVKSLAGHRGTRGDAASFP